ncbi:Amino acid permease family protein [Aspergillus niger]|nr:Amino acid permease family protein [Aspergillus niger]
MATWTSHSEILKGTKQPQPDQISSFLDLFEKTRNQYEIHPDDIWNADEKGFMLENRTGAQKFILSQKSIQHKGRKLLAPTEDWVSTIECCNTTGQLRISREVFFLLWWRSREEAMYPENVIMGWRNSGTWPVSKGVVYKRAGFDLPEARDVLDPTELKAPTNKEEFYTLLDQMLSSPPETSTQLREFLMDCFYQKSRSIDLLQENLTNHYDVQVDIERDLPETDAEVTKRRAEDDPAARTASGERALFKRQNMNSTPNPEPIQLSSQPIQPPNASLNAGPQPEWHSIRNSYGCIGSVLPQAGPSIHPTGQSSGISQYPGNLWQYES